MPVLRMKVVLLPPQEMHQVDNSKQAAAEDSISASQEPNRRPTQTVTLKFYRTPVKLNPNWSNIGTYWFNALFLLL